MHFPLLPLLSDEDKAETSEGGLDPLGLVQTSETLATKLVPGIRERMAHPRYLTAIAVGMEVCRKFPEDTIASDGVTPPWLTFEWIAVEAFARTAIGRDPFGLPGSLKAAAALRQRVPLSAARYLKTPTVFGFHGVYRVLARNLDIEAAGRLGETGYELLTAWCDEQKLSGFTGTAGGDGAHVCEQLYYAVRDSLQAGAVARRDGWKYWQFFRDYLSPNEVEAREAKVLRDALFTDKAGFRGAVLRFLVSSRGREVFEQTESERSFHEALRDSADPELGELLDAIASYEMFSRLCQDAFDDVLVELTRCSGNKVTPRELSRIETVKAACKRVPEVFGELLERLEPFHETAHFADTFASLAERTDAASWVDRLLRHHVSTQRRKPPAGKSPWVERFDDGSTIIRPLYRREQPSRGDDSYLHAYRTRSLYSFAHDLHMFTA